MMLARRMAMCAMAGLFIIMSEREGCDDDTTVRDH